MIQYMAFNFKNKRDKDGSNFTYRNDFIENFLYIVRKTDWCYSITMENNPDRHVENSLTIM